MDAGYVPLSKALVQLLQTRYVTSHLFLRRVAVHNNDLRTGDTSLPFGEVLHTRNTF